MQPFGRLLSVIDKGGMSVNTESLRNARALNDSVDEILNRYASMVYRLAFARTKNRFDADDILQEAFMRYIRSTPDCQDEEHRKAWLIRTTINCSKTMLSSAWFRKTAPLDDTLFSEMKEHSEVYYAVLALPVQYRTVIHLFYYEEYAVADIAKLLDCKQSTVKSRLHRARNLLREKLKGETFDVQG